MIAIRVIEKNDVLPHNWVIYRLSDKQVKKYGKRYAIHEEIVPEYIVDDEDEVKILKSLNSEQYEGFFNTKQDAIHHINLIGEKNRAEARLRYNLGLDEIKQEKEKENWYAFHWKDGSVTYSKGKSVSEAIHIGDNVCALDYWELVDEIPDKYKEVLVIDVDGDEFISTPDTMFYKQIHGDLLLGKDKIITVFCGKRFEYTVTKNNYQFVLKRREID